MDPSRYSIKTIDTAHYHHTRRSERTGSSRGIAWLPRALPAPDHPLACLAREIHQTAFQPPDYLLLEGARSINSDDFPAALEKRIYRVLDDPRESELFSAYMPHGVYLALRARQQRQQEEVSQHDNRIEKLCAALRTALDVTNLLRSSGRILAKRDIPKHLHRQFLEHLTADSDGLRSRLHPLLYHKLEEIYLPHRSP